ncbi:MAG TPA: class I SAM-dependent methyltransferase [Nocardioidaceae bacterium]|nr:class I SAM-dependent methyltransferase [Nocardioidaceae bacterium]
MTRTTVTMTPDLQAYVLEHNRPRPDGVLRDLAEETARAQGAQAQMQIGPEQGAFMTLLTRMVAPRLAVEVGTFTGYSALCIARGLPEGGRLLALDVSEEYTAVARRYWQRAGVDERIDLRIAPAIETLRALPRDAEIDLAFLDADKSGYIGYWEEIVGRMPPGGVVLADNVFAGGLVVESDADLDEGGEGSGMAESIKAFNAHAAADDRVEIAMLPIGDGLTVARRV